MFDMCLHNIEFKKEKVNDGICFPFGITSKAQAAQMTSAQNRQDDGHSSPVTSSVANFTYTSHGHKISWKPGDITKEKADVLVIPEGACFNGIKSSLSQTTIQALSKVNIGDIYVFSGTNLPCSHVIYGRCSFWDGSGNRAENTLRAIVEKCLRKVDELGGRSIAFPIIGTGNLGFPLHEASRIMLEEAIKTCERHQLTTMKEIHFVLYHGNKNLIYSFQQEAKKIPNHGTKTVQSFRTRGIGLMENVEVVHGNLIRETTDAIVNIIGTDMNLDTAGRLSKAIAQASGPQVQQECSQMGRQSPGSAVMTSGGNLSVRHIIHIVPGSSDKKDLQSCLEASLRLADASNFQSISIPAIGTGGFRLSAQDSAHVTFQALRNICGNFTSVSKVRVVVYKAQMLQAFQQEQHKFSPLVKPASASPSQPGYGSHVVVDVTSGDLTKETTDAIVNITGTNMNMSSIGQLSRAIAQASGPQVQQECSQLGKQSPGSAVMTSGGNLSVCHIIHLITGSSDKHHLQTCLEEGLRLADRNNLRSVSIPAIGTGVYGQSALDSAQLTFQALRNISSTPTSIVKVRIVVYQAQMLQAFQQELQKWSPLLRTTNEETSLPVNWDPIPSYVQNFVTVPLNVSSPEYSDVSQKFLATVPGVIITRIQRVQNPFRYRSYMLRKQKMDKDNGGNNERQLFHGTSANTAKLINAQGFNRSFCGKHGTAYGQGVYFAEDAGCSKGYTDVNDVERCMYLARVLVGNYCKGSSDMKVPPPKNSSQSEILYDSTVDNPVNPKIFVVFYDDQCYPEYLITFR